MPSKSSMPEAGQKPDVPVKEEKLSPPENHNRVANAQPQNQSPNPAPVSGTQITRDNAQRPDLPVTPGNQNLENPGVPHVLSPAKQAPNEGPFVNTRPDAAVSHPSPDYSPGQPIPGTSVANPLPPGHKLPEDMKTDLKNAKDARDRQEPLRLNEDKK